jgi:hypothetical protein
MGRPATGCRRSTAPHRVPGCRYKNLPTDPGEGVVGSARNVRVTWSGTVGLNDERYRCGAALATATLNGEAANPAEQKRRQAFSRFSPRHILAVVRTGRAVANWPHRSNQRRTPLLVHNRIVGRWPPKDSWVAPARVPRSGRRPLGRPKCRQHLVVRPGWWLLAGACCRRLVSPGWGRHPRTVQLVAVHDEHRDCGDHRRHQQYQTDPAVPAQKSVTRRLSVEPCFRGLNCCSFGGVTVRRPGEAPMSGRRIADRGARCSGRLRDMRGVIAVLRRRHGGPSRCVDSHGPNTDRRQHPSQVFFRERSC